MISIEHHNSTSNGPVNTKSSISGEFIPFFLSENSKGDLYKICQGITWFVVKLGSKRIPRAALASFAGCHVDTVSSVNMRLEEAGIFSISRAIKKPNVYSSEFLHVLSVVFGYVKYYSQSSASHILNLLDFNLSYNYKESDSSTKVGVISPTREENKTISEKITKSDTKSPTRSAPVVRPSVSVLCTYKPSLSTKVNENAKFSLVETIYCESGAGLNSNLYFPDYEKIESDRERREVENQEYLKQLAESEESRRLEEERFRISPKLTKEQGYELLKKNEWI